MPRSRRSSSASRNARRPTPISARPSNQSNTEAMRRTAIRRPIVYPDFTFSASLHARFRSRPTPAPTRPNLDLSKEVIHAAPMTPQQIKQSIETRPDTNQDIKFMEKKKCRVCLGSWKAILMEGKHLVFTECNHIFCRDCATKFAAEGKKECPLCKKSLIGVCPPFRRLHVHLDPRLKKSRAD